MLWLLKIKVLLGILFCFNFAQGSLFSLKDFEVAAGVQGSSLLHKRGIITYEGYQVVPIYSVQLFNPHLFLAGSALYYKHNLSESLLLRTRINFDATLDTPLYETLDDDEVPRVRRESTTEFDVYLEYSFSRESFFRLLGSQDLVAHKGHYFELYGYLGLIDLYKQRRERALAQLGLFSSVGYGSREHNEYLYGLGASDAGLNNVEYGLAIISPKVIDSFWPTLKVTRFSIQGDKNKVASYVRETKGWSVEALIAFKVW